MKKLLTTLLPFLILVAFLFAVGYMVVQKTPSQQQSLKGTSDTDLVISNFTKGSASVSSTRTLVLDANTARREAFICLDGTTANFPAYLFLTSASTTVATSSGKPIMSMTTSNGDNCLVIGANFFYTGQVWAITNTSTAQTITTLEN